MFEVKVKTMRGYKLRALCETVEEGNAAAAPFRLDGISVIVCPWDREARYLDALNWALDMMQAHEGLEPTSALKQAASDILIPYGDRMGEFVQWANNELFGES